jgi:acetyl/propionyl-CoA carboxylase alpha subunit
VEQRLTITDERGEHTVAILDDGQVVVDEVAVVTRSIGDGEVRVGAGGSTVAWVAASGDMRWVFVNGNVYELDVRPAGGRRRVTAGHTSLAAPMPATVIRVEVSPGTRVSRGDTLVILEAMKMELPIRADSDGTVTRVACKPGDLVQPGVALVEIE